MKLINPNNEILKFIENKIKNSSEFFNFEKNEYNHDLILETKGKDIIAIVSLLLECEDEFGISINDDEVWNVQTPLDVYNIIVKKLKEK